MKKFLKFLFCTFSLAAAAFGVYYLVKNVICKDESEDDFDEFDDDFDEFETEKDSNASDSREYVPINLSGSEEEATEETSDNSKAEEADSSKEAETEE